MNNKNILVPNLPESINDAVVAIWHKKQGDHVNQGEVLVELETDKIMLEVPAEETGILGTILEDSGAIVISGQTLGILLVNDIINNEIHMDKKQDIHSEPFLKPSQTTDILKKEDNDDYIKNFTPSVRRIIKKYDLQLKLILKDNFYGRITRDNVKKYFSENKKDDSSISPLALHTEVNKSYLHRNEQRVSMSRLRQRIAERLLDVKNNTVMLTTFNEVNMGPIINVRKKFGDIFEKKHGVRLGFMSFYVKAVLEGLKEFPEINASIDGKEIVYHNYFDISIAVSTSRGLVTPVLKDINLLSIADIEKKIKDVAVKGRDGKLTLEELSGGNFTITNGGVFGSLISTPIINPPQTAILGMHAIQERPMVVNGKIIVLPMMYLALSYDHRLIDGKDSIGFLIKIKNILEDPVRFLLNI